MNSLIESNPKVMCGKPVIKFKNQDLSIQTLNDELWIL